MKFVDEIEVRIRGGHGGAGSVHFLREKYRAFGGPDGGDGGDGGDVYLEAHSSIMTLGHLMKHTLYSATAGEPGRGKNCHGARGEDLTIHVPVGTEVVDTLEGVILGDLHHPGERLLVAKGGRGGMGNQHFATSVNQAPEYAQPGLPGEEKRLLLNLKLLADAGLIGLPNAGKSTLLAAVSHSHPKIADYAFTTLTPNIGVVENENFRRFILADIPGIIEGAHRGAGLGLSFLRHIERVRVMVYVLDVGSLDAVADLRMLQEELAPYSPELLKRPALIVLNKLDQAKYDEEFAAGIAEELQDPSLWEGTPGGIPEVLSISALEKQGLETLVTRLFSFFAEETLAEQMLLHKPFLPDREGESEGE